MLTEVGRVSPQNYVNLGLHNKIMGNVPGEHLFGIPKPSGLHNVLTSNITVTKL